MGDLSTEPSMEDILSSIKRIISEEGEAGVQSSPRARRAAIRAAPMTPRADDYDNVLELSDPMPGTVPSEGLRPSAGAAAPGESIASNQTAQATRGALEALSRLVVKPEPGADGTLEGLVRDMLRPMLRDWIDANLPAMVETLVAREITRITHEGR